MSPTHQKPNRILLATQWREKHGISKSTAWRMKKEGRGPKFFNLSKRLLATTEADDEEWMQSLIKGKSA
jgi:predicted DNA-binding transcriptional regulator AlpA